MPSARDLGIQIGSLPSGALNAITDVEGLSVGQVTLSDGSVQTGVTAILPHGGSLFREKLPAAVQVFNGFGKSIGFVQIEELGTLESPLVLTNTLSVGTASEALVRYLLAQNPEIGTTTGTVNPVVLECNDGAWLNDIRGLHVTAAHVEEALKSATPGPFAQGAVGAGTGMSAYGLKGGIGSASRVVSLAGRDVVLGALVLSNMGRLSDLTVAGRQLGPAIAKDLKKRDATREQGSIIVILATDAPVSDRQLRRIASRAGAGIARTGSHFGSGSGDIALAFSTAAKIPHAKPMDPVLQRWQLHEDALDPLFRAVIESTEEAILNSMLYAVPTVGRDGRSRASLADFADLLAGAGT
ncbi:P1 family peptidase [Pelagibius sp. Alg239-R121]|uniref:DmpA family aminopeptidase n=1 Tax=Pelagibius sp. Alg239-R121 TaxID=2993448 RepID=UPI0024A795E2|nr:P1 family peptidase [Pelagibius sp. Alg239-R121]